MTESDSLHADLTKAFKHCFEPSGVQQLTSTSQIASINNATNPRVYDEHIIRDSFQPTLKKWRNGQYMSRNPTLPLMAYVLPGSNQCNANQGIAGLNQSSASIVSSLVPIAKSLGFSVFVANMVKEVFGIPHEDDFTYEFIPSYHKRRRLGFDDDAYESFCESKGHGYLFSEDFLSDYRRYQDGHYDPPRMGKVLREKQLLYGLTSVDGSDIPLINIGSVRIKKENLIARTNDFGISDPQHKRFDPDNGEVRWVYDRCVVGLCPAHEELISLILALKGPYWSLRFLEASTTQNTSATAVVSASLRKLDADESKTRFRRLKWWKPKPAPQLLVHATEWKDHDLWSRAMHHCQYMSMKELMPAAVKALAVFGIEPIREGLKLLLQSKGSLTQRFEFIEMIASAYHEGTSDEWLEGLRQKALLLCTKPTLQDLPILVSVTEARGPKVILSLIPHMEKNGTFEPLMALAQALYNLYDSTDTSAHDKAHLMDATRQCVSAAAPQWEWDIDIQSPDIWSENEIFTTENDATKRICEIVQFCHTIDYLQPCIELFNSLCQFISDAYIPSRLGQIHAPLSIHLKTTLAGIGKSANTEPFTSFYRNIISLYLAHALCLPSLWRPLVVAQPRRLHVESQIHKEKIYLENYVTTRTVEFGSPYTLGVRKCDAVVAALRWAEQQKQAEVFIRCVCPDEKSLREVMGDRYDDVMSALEGKRRFVLGDLVFADVVTSHGKPMPKSAKATTLAGASASVTCGTKRKHG